jgi:hypothetical protein
MFWLSWPHDLHARSEGRGAGPINPAPAQRLCTSALSKAHFNRLLA